MAEQTDQAKLVIKRKDLEAHSVATRVIRANRKITGQATLAVVLAILLSVATTTAIVFSRPTHVTDAQLVDANGKTVETGTALRTTDLVSLAAEGDLSKLDHLKSLRILDVDARNTQLLAALKANTSLPTVGEAIRSVAVDSWSWVNADRMTVSGTDGTKVLVSNGQVRIKGPPDGYAAFDAGGVGFGTDGRTNLSALVKECDRHNCPKASCSIHTYHGTAIQVSCGGSTVWRWPAGVTLPKSNVRRQLSEGKCVSDYDDCCYNRCGGVMSIVFSYTRWSACADMCYDMEYAKCSKGVTQV